MRKVDFYDGHCTKIPLWQLSPFPLVRQWRGLSNVAAEQLQNLGAALGVVEPQALGRWGRAEHSTAP